MMNINGIKRLLQQGDLMQRPPINQPPVQPNPMNLNGLKRNLVSAQPMMNQPPVQPNPAIAPPLLQKRLPFGRFKGPVGTGMVRG